MTKQRRGKRTFWLVDNSSETFKVFSFETSRYGTVEDGEFFAWFGHSRHTVGEDCWETEQDAEDARRGLILNEIQALSDYIKTLAGCLY